MGDNPPVSRYTLPSLQHVAIAVIVSQRIIECMDDTNVVLTGFMGTGKSTVGRLLALELGYLFVDTDNLVAQRAGKPVPLIFAEDGEPVFRDWEERIAAEVAPPQRLVIATGGGLMLNERNAEALQAGGWVFCLTATPKQIWQRVQKSGGQRPLLDVSQPVQRIEELLTERALVYKRYPQIETDRRSPAKVVQEIVKQIAQHQQMNRDV